jgi:hypothetical protein
MKQGELHDMMRGSTCPLSPRAGVASARSNQTNTYMLSVMANCAQRIIYVSTIKDFILDVQDMMESQHTRTHSPRPDFQVGILQISLQSMVADMRKAHHKTIGYKLISL